MFGISFFPSLVDAGNICLILVLIIILYAAEVTSIILVLFNCILFYFFKGKIIQGTNFENILTVQFQINKESLHSHPFLTTQFQN